MGDNKKKSKSMLDVTKKKAALNKKRAEAIKTGNFREVKRLNKLLKEIK